MQKREKRPPKGACAASKEEDMPGEGPLRTARAEKKPAGRARAGSAERTQTLRMMPMGVDSLD